MLHKYKIPPKASLTTEKLIRQQLERAGGQQVSAGQGGVERSRGDTWHWARTCVPLGTRRNLCHSARVMLYTNSTVASPLAVLVQRTLLAITVNSAAYAAASLPPAVASATEGSWGCLLRRLRLKHTLIVYR